MPDHPSSDALPTDAQSILALAARSLFDVFANASEGMLLVDRSGRVVWINDQYRRFLPALGFAREEDFVGQPVSAVVENTQMLQVLETGKPILIDLLVNKAGTFVVSRFPLCDEMGRVIGALGVVLFEQPQANLQPLLAKFALLQRELDDARQALAVQQRRAGGLWRAKHSLASFIGTSAAALEAKRQARRAAQSSSPVLLLGETGSGKELLAHAIHTASRRAQAPFVSVNIAAVPDTLMEAEFFGVAPGAYTGAERKGRDGKFKLADGGTLFLDEIGDMPLTLQAKLLRALQEGEVVPIGATQPIKVDVRIIAATNKDLEPMIAAGQFREDLYYRLNVVPILLPPLRERADDIPALARHFLHLAAAEGLPRHQLADDAAALLARQPWRGNVRELRNFIFRLALLAREELVDVETLGPLLLKQGTRSEGEGSPDLDGAVIQWLAQNRPPAGRVYDAALAAFERPLFIETLRETGGNQLRAAQLLGINRNTLRKRLHELAIDPGELLRTN
mgnify:CR=1 FL=1